MDEEQKLALALYLAGWLDKMGVGFFMVGIFQPAHMFGGIIGGIICLLIGVCIKVRVPK